ncbi:hypothetical protein TWF718_007707 [Orbilia javanica]|uniref:Uncharacterized protein n=1 Tax=Orbilia javanica TaxID=47235 RepID=A0AAN8MRL1_9PEZI
MSSFQITITPDVEKRNLLITWTKDPNVIALDIQLRRKLKDAAPYFTKRVPCQDESLTLTPEDYAPGYSQYALIPRYVSACPVLAPTEAEPHRQLPFYKQWTDRPVGNFEALLGKNASLASWGNRWGTVGYHFSGVAWTDQNTVVAYAGDQTVLNSNFMSLEAEGVAGPPDGGAITRFWNSSEKNAQKAFAIGSDGSVNIVRILAPNEHTYNPGSTTNVAPAGSAMTIGGGSICVVYNWLISSNDDVWDAWWVTPDGHIMHTESHSAPQTTPKILGRVKVWHDEDRVTALTGQSLRQPNSKDKNADVIMWFVAKHGTGLKGNLYQSSRIGDETTTTEVMQDDEECFVAPGSGISSQCWNKGPVVAWITPEGAVMTLHQDFKVENDPVFREVAPAGSAALESTVCLAGPFIWWFGPNWELMGAAAEDFYKSEVEYKDITWNVWEILPAGVGRKGKDSIVCGDSGPTRSVWFAGADNKPHSLELDD